MISAIFEDAVEGAALSVLLGPRHPVPQGKGTLFEAIAQQCVLRPEAIALSYGDQTISYGQLGHTAAVIAAALQAAGLRPGALVPVVTAGGPAMITAMIGLWAARAAFAPIAADAPASRRDMALSVIAEAAEGLPIALVDETTCVVAGWKTIVLADLLATVPEPGARTLMQGAGPAPDDLAYGFFTSGSTGVPKCCLNIHSGLANRAAAMTRRFGLAAGEAVLQNSSHVFDSSLWQIFWPLSVGAKVVIPKRNGILDLEATLAQIAAHSVRMTDFVPSIMERLVQLMQQSDRAQQQFSCLRTLLVGGEALGLKLLKDLRCLFPDLQLVNTYGPTEASIGMVFHLFDGSETRIPLGLPIDNCALAVVGADIMPLPLGETGQIVIGGACMGLGYLGLPERNAAVFLTHSGLNLGSATVYCTGDLGYVGADGLLYFAGRSDDQVKIGGVRIEPGEIEHRLRSFQGIERAKVVPVQREGEGESETWLAAFFTASHEICPGALREFLRAELGPSCIPALLLQVTDFPTTASGKVDAKALVATVCSQPLPTETATGINADKDLHRLMAIAQKALPGQAFGPTDDLGLLGLDSLAALSLVLEAERLSGCRLSMEAFLAMPTLAALLAPQPDMAGPETCADAQVLADIARLSHSHTVPKGSCDSPDGPILLTGATGYVGAALLAALLDAGAPQILCLVRAPDTAMAQARIREILPKGVDPDRVLAVAGDLAAVQDWKDKLPARLSAVVHAAADVNLSRSYHQLRTTNLEATAHLCQIAQDRGAVLHHVSSVAVFGGGALRADLRGQMPEPKMAIKALKSGYSRSKWAAEQVVIARRKVGLKAEIYRLGEMAPDAIYPRINPLSSVSILAEAARRIGALPLLDEVTDCTPTGLVAQWIAARCLAGAPADAGLCAHLLVDPTRHPVVVVLEGMTGPLPRVAADAFAGQLECAQTRTPHPALARALMLMRSATEAPLFQPAGRTATLGGAAVLLPWPVAAPAPLPGSARPLAATGAQYDISHGEALLWQ